MIGIGIMDQHVNLDKTTANPLENLMVDNNQELLALDQNVAMNIDFSEFLDQNNTSITNPGKDSSKILDQIANVVVHENTPKTLSNNVGVLGDLHSESAELVTTSLQKRNFCTYCSKQLLNITSLRKHFLQVHGIKFPEKLFHCAYCEKKFKYEYRLESHCAKEHQQPKLIDTSWITDNKDLVLSKRDKCQVRCVECNIKYATLQKLRQHLSKHHNMNFAEKEIRFPNIIAFKKWKLDVERRDRTIFAAISGIQKFPKFGLRMYRCNRSGIHESRRPKGKLKMNAYGSCKTGITCTANIITHEYANEVRVKYCLQHYGHGEGATFLQLSAEEQAAVEENVSNGIPLEEQLEDIKHAQSLNEHFQIRYIKRRDIFFLKSAYVSEIYNAGMNASEFVEQWVRACSEMEESPILLYRHEGIGTEAEDFMLIIMTEFQKHILLTSSKEAVCLDSHRCVKKGSHFLTSLFVMDEQDVAFPVAFCICKKMNKDSMLEFLSSVKEYTGPLSFLYFMSNNDKVSYEAWREVMQDESTWIWSIWTFEERLRNPRYKLMKDVHTREDTYRILRTVMECNNQQVFVTMLKNCLKSLSDNSLSTEFGKFFESEYGSNQELWACCYRKDLKFSTNFYFDSLHKTFEDCAKVSRTKELDKFLMVLMKYLRFKMIDRLSNMLDEEKIDLAKKTITMCHNMGIDIEGEKIHSLSDNIWLIRSENEVEAYVTKEYESCPELCDLRCPDCDVCVHMYSCSCVHSIINANMCKHIHAVVWKFVTPHFSPPASPVQDPCDDSCDIPTLTRLDPDLLQSILKRLQDIYKKVRMNKCQLNKNSLLSALRLLDRCYEVCSNEDLSSGLKTNSTQTETISSVHALNGLIKAVLRSNSENIAPISVGQSNSVCNVQANISSNSSKLHEKSNLSPSVLAVKNIKLSSEGSPNPTSIIVVPVSSNLGNSISNSSKRQNLIGTIIPSVGLNQISNVTGNSKSTEKHKVVVTPSNPKPDDEIKNLSAPGRPEKRTFLHVSPLLLQDLGSHVAHGKKRRYFKRISFQGAPIDSTTMMETTVSNFPSEVSYDTKQTRSAKFVERFSGHPASSDYSESPTNTSKIRSLKEAFDKMSSSGNLSNPVSSNLNNLIPNSPIVISSSENHMNSNAPCIISSIYSLNNWSDNSSQLSAPAATNEQDSRILLDSVPKKGDSVNLKTQISPVSSFLCVPKCEPPEEESSVLPPSVPSFGATSTSPIVIKFPDSTKPKSSLETTTKDMDVQTKNDPNRKVLQRRKCTVCGSPAPGLFVIPKVKESYEKWFSALKWDIPPERLRYVLRNARVCGKHFTESCFTSTLRTKLLKFACPHLTDDDTASTSTDAVSAVSSATSKCSSVDISNTEPECRKNPVPSSTAHDITSHLEDKQNDCEQQKSEEKKGKS